MALPSNVGTCLVIGTFLRAVVDDVDADRDPDGVPIEGMTVTFTAAVSRARNVSAVPPVTIIFDPIVCSTDATGQLVGPDGQPGVRLVASDDPDLDPTDWTYKVRLVGPAPFTPIEFSFVAPVGGTVDLTIVMPVVGSSGTPSGQVSWSAIIGIGGTPDGTKFLRDDGTWADAGGSWGGITGTLSDQTDLQGALDVAAASGAVNPFSYYHDVFDAGDHYIPPSEPGAGWASDGEWNSGENGQLVVMPFDSGVDAVVNRLATKVFNTDPGGTSEIGIWASGPDGLPTGLPVWTSTVDVTTSGNKFIDVSPTVAFAKGTRLWVGWLHTGWTTGAIKRQRSTVGGNDMYSNLGSAFENDANGILIPVTGPAIFAQTRYLDAATTIATNLTGVTWSPTGSRPNIIMRVNVT